MRGAFVNNDLDKSSDQEWRLGPWEEQVGPEHLLSRRTFSLEEEMLELKYSLFTTGEWVMMESKTELEGSNL